MCAWLPKSLNSSDAKGDQLLCYKHCCFSDVNYFVIMLG